MIKRSSSFLILLIILVSPVVSFVSCEKEKMPAQAPVYNFEIDSVTDIEGNVYKTVKIGEQWWMTENLRVSRYRNNSYIYFNSSMTEKEWSLLSTGSYCNLFNSALPFNGYLYNWYAVTSPAGLAPEGWRIPTDEDWKTLEKHLGMHPDTLDMTGWRGTGVGEKMKSPKVNNVLYWLLDKAINNTNESGLTALPGGCRLADGKFSDTQPNFTGFWWSSTQVDENNVWYRYLDYSYNSVFRYYADKNCGYSVRCVKDAAP